MAPGTPNAVTCSSLAITLVVYTFSQKTRVLWLALSVIIYTWTECPWSDMAVSVYFERRSNWCWTVQVWLAEKPLICSALDPMADFSIFRRQRRSARRRLSCLWAPCQHAAKKTPAHAGSFDRVSASPDQLNKPVRPMHRWWCLEIAKNATVYKVASRHKLASASPLVRRLPFLLYCVCGSYA